MPRKLITASVALLLICTGISGCAAEKEEPVVSEPVTEQTPLPQSTPVPTPQPTPEVTVQQVDIDLTPFNNNMAYAEIMNMTLAPEDYNGKSIRLRGEFSRYSDMDENGQAVPDSEHRLCIVYDTMGCCAQGVELLLKEVPAEFPAEEQEITVSGTCNIYMDEYEFVIFELEEAIIE